MANLAYNKGKTILGGAADWTAGGQTYKVLLTTGTYTPNADDDFVSNVTNELSGGGYARATISNRSASEDTAGDKGDFKADNTTFSGLSSTQTVRWVVVFKDNGGADTANELICAIDLTSVNLTGLTDWTIKWDGQATNGRVFSIT